MTTKQKYLKQLISEGWNELKVIKDITLEHGKTFTAKDETFVLELLDEIEQEKQKALQIENDLTYFEKLQKIYKTVIDVTYEESKTGDITDKNLTQLQKLQNIAENHTKVLSDEDKTEQGVTINFGKIPENQLETTK